MSSNKKLLENSVIDFTDQSLEPYVGPRSFRRDIEDQSRFFGRDAETDEVVSLITSHRLVLIYAQSGAGKTSIFNAQVIPMLESYGFEVLPMTRVHVTTTSTPIISKNLSDNNSDTSSSQIENIYIYNALQRLRQDIDSRLLKNSLQRLRQDIDSRLLKDLSLFEFLDGYFPNNKDENGDLRPQVLIFDQFEELFSFPDIEQQKGFFEQIGDSLENNPLLKIVFIIREDYLAQLDPFKGLLLEKLRPSFRLERLRRNEAILAIKGPLTKILNEDEVKNIDSEIKELVSDLLKTYIEIPGGGLRQIEGEYVEPIYLQVVCRRWWHEISASKGSDDRKEISKDLTNVDKALEDFYEQAVLSASKRTGVHESKIRNWCQEKLMTSSRTRSIIHRDVNSTEGMNNAVVDVLKDNYLLRREWRSGAQWYELTHDRLIKPIFDSNDKWKYENEKKKKNQILKVLVPSLAVAVIVISVLLIYGLYFTHNNLPSSSGPIGVIGNSPVSISINPSTNIVYVANTGSNTVSVINGTTNSVVKNITAVSNPTALSVNPSTNIVYVANEFDNTVSVINGTTNSVVKNITAVSNPTALSVNPSTNIVYVANDVDNTVSVIDGTTNSVTSIIQVGFEPTALSVNPSTNIVYVANSFSDTVSLIDGKTNSVIQNIKGDG